MAEEEKDKSGEEDEKTPLLEALTAENERLKKENAKLLKEQKYMLDHMSVAPAKEEKPKYKIVGGKIYERK